ncbi:MAG TPA: chorismate synthase, partial [Candidatus Goldiibacteriota bacterium]|nr:chorismate synthase [Candidatus Goldiibacteriota bacterium]
MRYMTAGESHGKGLVAIIDGVPSQLELSADDIDIFLAGRQKGYGRGGRQKIESDKVEIISGVRHGRTIGSPIALLIKNRDFVSWRDMMSCEPVKMPVKEFVVPRPGHADLSGGMKYGHYDLRNVLERASARETAARVAAGAVCIKALAALGVRVLGYVTSIGGIKAEDPVLPIMKIEERMRAVQKKVPGD